MNKNFYNKQHSGFFFVQNNEIRKKFRGDSIIVAIAIVDFIRFKAVRNQPIYKGSISTAYDKSLISVEDFMKVTDKLLRLGIIIKTHTDELKLGIDLKDFLTHNSRPLIQKNKNPTESKKDILNLAFVEAGLEDIEYKKKIGNKLGISTYAQKLFERGMDYKDIYENRHLIINKFCKGKEQANLEENQLTWGQKIELYLLSFLKDRMHENDFKKLGYVPNNDNINWLRKVYTCEFITLTYFKNEEINVTKIEQITNELIELTDIELQNNEKRRGNIVDIMIHQIKDNEIELTEEYMSFLRSELQKYPPKYEIVGNIQIDTDVYEQATEEDYILPGEVEYPDKEIDHEFLKLMKGTL